MKTNCRKSKVKARHRRWHSIWNFSLDMIISAASFLLGINICKNVWQLIFIGVWGVAFVMKILVFQKMQMTLAEYNKIQMSEKLSSAMLQVQQQSNAYKTRHVLQITYGNVPRWRPFNYYENVLVYDVHEQIRTILLELKQAIITMIPEFDMDSVTVDLVYCYPDELYDGRLPADKGDVDKWRLISSRDGSSMNYKVHDFLDNNESFYFHLDQNNFIFFNEKTQEGRYYLHSGKDQEYGRTGSIVGLSLNVKNDVPEKVLVKAMLTITTYGRKLREDDDPVGESDYIKLFKKNVLNTYKTMLESELAQMYIRHMIREKNMCPYSGAIVQQQEEVVKKLVSHGIECPYKTTNEKCTLIDTECDVKEFILEPRERLEKAVREAPKAILKEAEDTSVEPSADTLPQV